MKGTSHVERISRVGLVMTCGRCGQKGHKKSKCVNKEVEVGDKVPKKPGRPRKTPTSGATSSRGQASLKVSGQTGRAEASVEVGGNCWGQATVSVGGEDGSQATVHLSGSSESRSEPRTPIHRPVDPSTLRGFGTPMVTQQSQSNATSPPPPKRRWTRESIVRAQQTPIKATSAGPSRKYEDNVVMGSHSVLTKASAALGVTSTGYKKTKTQGMVF